MYLPTRSKPYLLINLIPEIPTYLPLGYNSIDSAASYPHLSNHKTNWEIDAGQLFPLFTPI